MMTKNIPTSWADVTIAKQIRFEELNAADSGQTAINLISAYCELDIEEVKKMHVNVIKEILTKLDFVTSLPSVPVDRFVHDNIEYNVTESLLKSEFQDFLSLENIGKRFKGNDVRSLPYIIAVLAKRQGESLSDYDIEERAKEFLSLPMSTAYGLWLFFCASAKSFTADPILLKTVNEAILRSVKDIENTTKQLVGMRLLTSLLAVILQNLSRYLLRKWNSYCSGLTSKQRKTN